LTQSPAQLGPTEVSPPPLDPAHRSPLLQTKMSGLDALRGIAVLSVFFRHAFSLAVEPGMSLSLKLLLTTFRFGWLGVDLFFVLSGFLITGILLDTRHRPHYWRNFYTRRALRILPFYIATLLLLRVTLHLGWGYLALCLLFLANFAENRGFAVYNPLWSLAVEEQFYLVWPSLVRKLSLRTLAMLCILSILISPVLRGITTTYHLGNPYDATWLITDPLALGALLAIFLRSALATARNTRRLAIALFSLFAVLTLAGLRLHFFSRATSSGDALQTEPFLFFFGFLVLVALYLGNNPRLLRLTLPFRFYGYIAYGFYLLHQLAFLGVDTLLLHYNHLPSTPTAGFLITRCVLTLIPTTLLCWLSRRFYEEFFLRFKDHLAPYAKL
jgi:peptidoglycan/LPS O-acetylase OafA/YrhL